VTLVLKIAFLTSHANANPFHEGWEKARIGEYSVAGQDKSSFIKETW
jgi:hypothetical protein